MSTNRMWHKVVLLVMLASMTILSACGRSSEAQFDTEGKKAEEGMDQSNTAERVDLGATDNGATVELAVGQELVVSLSSNPTTGYSWEISEIDADILSQEGDPEYLQGGSEGLVGAGGTEVFHFSAGASGKTTLMLIYHRAWETGVPPIETFTVDVIVP